MLSKSTNILTGKVLESLFYRMFFYFIMTDVINVSVTLMLQPVNMGLILRTLHVTSLLPSLKHIILTYNNAP